MQIRHFVTPIAALLTLSATVFSFADGVLPGKTHPTLGSVPSTVVRSAPGCGMCHGTAPSTVAVDVTPILRVLDAGQSTSIRTVTTGGLMAPGAETAGGFVTEVTRGRLIAGSGSIVSPDGLFATHSDPTTGARSWLYGYTAPAAPGLVDVYAAGNTVDGDGTPMGDQWAFHGAVGEQLLSTPIKMFVNAPGVTRRGAGCEGGAGSWPILGSQQPPTVGNPLFGFELHGANPNTPLTMFIGMNPTYSVELSPAGVTGCTLFVNPFLQRQGVTTPGPTGGATYTFGLPIPNVPAFRGFSFELQAILFDDDAPRPLPLTLTNAVGFTVQ